MSNIEVSLYLIKDEVELSVGLVHFVSLVQAEEGSSQQMFRIVHDDLQKNRFIISLIVHADLQKNRLSVSLIVHDDLQKQDLQKQDRLLFSVSWTVKFFGGNPLFSIRVTKYSYSTAMILVSIISIFKE